MSETGRDWSSEENTSGEEDFASTTEIAIQRIDDPCPTTKAYRQNDIPLQDGRALTPHQHSRK